MAGSSVSLAAQGVLVNLLPGKTEISDQVEGHLVPHLRGWLPNNPAEQQGSCEHSEPVEGSPESDEGGHQGFQLAGETEKINCG